MKPLVISIMICMLLAVSTQSIAQQGHVYEDSSIMYDQPTEKIEEVQVVEAPQQSEEYEETESTYTKDTFLNSNRLFLSPDSLYALRRDKQFGYAKNLDSLLIDIKRKQEEAAAREKAKRDKDRNTYNNIDEDKPGWLDRLFNSNILQIGLWSLAGLFLLFVVYKLFLGAGAFERTAKKDNVKIEEEPGDVLPVQERQFDAAIKKAMAENNYRVAVRYLYLQLLQRLSAAGAIQFAADKTNAEYLREINGKPYKEEVRQLTMYYDYVWYGDFTIDRVTYEKIESSFKKVTI